MAKGGKREMYRFYYDESEHSRKINDKTIKSDNYYDNFASVIVGWPKEKEQDVLKNIHPLKQNMRVEKIRREN